MNDHVLGAQLFTVRDYCKTLPDIAATLKKIYDIGYRAVQVSGIAPVDPAELGKILAASGMTVAATHMGWPRFLTQLDQVIAEHKMWNCQHAAIGSLPSEYYSAEGVKRFLAELVPVATKLLDNGIDFSYHNHAAEFMKVGERTMIATLYEDSDPRLLKAELDVYWVQAGGANPAAWITRLAGRQPILHLKDYVMGPDRQPRFGEIGEGNLDWPAILEAARQAKVQWYLVEQDNCYDRNPFDSLAISYRNLGKMGLK